MSLQPKNGPIFLQYFQYSIDNIVVREIQVIFFNCVTFLGISVSSKMDGVIVLHLPIEDKGDKVSLSILWKYWFYHHLHSSSHTEVKWFFFRFIMCNPQCLTWSSLFSRILTLQRQCKTDIPLLTPKFFKVLWHSSWSFQGDLILTSTHVIETVVYILNALNNNQLLKIETGE